MRAGLIEVPLHERDRLGEGGRANRDRERRDDQQHSEIGRESKQGVADGGPGERQEERRDGCPPVDPGAKGGAEGDTAERPRGQDCAQGKRAELRLIDEEQHDVGAGDRVREAREHIDDDKRDEEGRAVDVRCQQSLGIAANDAQFISRKNRPPSETNS